MKSILVWSVNRTTRRMIPRVIETDNTMAVGLLVNAHDNPTMNEKYNVSITRIA